MPLTANRIRGTLSMGSVTKCAASCESERARVRFNPARFRAAMPLVQLRPLAGALRAGCDSSALMPALSSPRSREMVRGN